jgi:PKD repeat protein
MTQTALAHTHTYTRATPYTVTLTASGLGGSDTVTRTSYITAYQPVTAAFSAAPPTGMAPLTVTFTNGSSSNAETYAWEFGDNSTSIDESPVHTYYMTGAFTVVMTASNPASSAAATTTITVTDSGAEATVTKYYYFGSQRVAMHKGVEVYCLHTATI